MYQCGPLKLRLWWAIHVHHTFLSGKGKVRASSQVHIVYPSQVPRVMLCRALSCLHLGLLVMGIYLQLCRGWVARWSSWLHHCIIEACVELLVMRPKLSHLGELLVSLPTNPVSSMFSGGCTCFAYGLTPEIRGLSCTCVRQCVCTAVQGNQGFYGG